MKVRITLAALLVFILGGAAGYVIPHRFEETIAHRKIDYFHVCEARLKQPHFTTLSWDGSAKQRALDILGEQADCINMAGIGGLSVGQLECASGYSEMPYEALLQAPSTHDPNVEQVIRTHRRVVDADYCAGRVMKIRDLGTRR